MLLRQVSIGEVPPTPASPLAAAPTPASETALLEAACRLGEPVGYVQEHGGRLVQNIVPERATADRQTSTSSAVTLQWHTETAFHPHKPHYLLLLCLRGDPEAATFLCALDDLLPELDEATVAALSQPRFRTRPDETFLERGGEDRLGPPLAVIGGTADEPVFTFDEDLMVGTDPEAQRALERLGRAVHARATAVTLEAGDLLVIDNHRVVHGRSAFHARYDGTDRWLQRTFVVDDLAPSAGEREGRIITTRF